MGIPLNRTPPTIQLAILKDASIIHTPGHRQAVVRVHPQGDKYSKIMGWQLTVLETGCWTKEVAQRRLNDWLSRYSRNEPGLP